MWTFCFLLRAGLGWRQIVRHNSWLDGSSLPICLGSAISAAFIARLIKGCRGDDPAGRFVFKKQPSIFNALTSILAGQTALKGGFVLRQQESQMPKLKTKSGAKKRFKVTATGKVLHAQRGKRHGMIKRTKKQIRQLRGTRVLFKTDGDNIKKYFLPYA
jgi:large subunit ribosomal protein L35